MNELYQLSIDERCVILAEYLVANHSTVRAVAQEFNISKSTVHKDISKTLKGVDHTLYKQAKEVMEINKKERHLRGGEATRQKYTKHLKSKL